MELVDLTELKKVLEDYAKDIRENYKDVLANNDHIASKNLVNSIRTEVVVGATAYEVTMTLADYWKYIEYGSKPHWLPYDETEHTFPDLLKWIQVKPVIPRPDSNGRIPTQKQLAFLIARKIADEGTKGTHDLQKTKDNILPWYRERISQALGRDMEKYILKLVRE